MRKASLKKKTGCLRCKRRHKRCDELKPKCSYCTRWQLECLWPETTSSETKAQATTSSQNSDGPDLLNSDPSQFQHISLIKTDDIRSGFYPLHNLAQRNSGEVSTGSKWVQQFFVANISANNTYDATDAHSEIVLGWPEFAVTDKAACAAQVASWAASSVQRRENSNGIVVGPEFETLTISRLRRAISPGAPVSEEMLLAATVYFIVSSGDLFNASQLHKMVEGIVVMVMSYGGIDAVLQRMGASTVLAVLHCDIFGSLLNAEQHFFVQLEKPKRPQTLTEAYRVQSSDIDISQYVTADVVEVFDELGLLLYFRQPSNKSRTLSEHERRHLLLLDQWIDYRLGVLQTSHINDCSLSELFVVALIILKQEIMVDAAQHTILVSTLLARLQTSISQFQIRAFASEPESELLQTLTVWTSLIALAGIPLTLQRLWFADYIHNSLTCRHGPIQDWPESWDDDLRIELQQFLWHDRIATRYTALCTEIRGHQQARGFT